MVSGADYTFENWEKFIGSEPGENIKKPSEATIAKAQ
jgi:hypothetical protein